MHRNFSHLKFLYKLLSQINLKWIWLAAIVLLVVLMFLYVIQVGRLTENIFLIEDYQKKSSQLAQENERLEANLFQVNSLASLESLLRGLNYVEVDRIYYLRILEGAMAAK